MATRKTKTTKTNTANKTAKTTKTAKPKPKLQPVKTHLQQVEIPDNTPLYTQHDNTARTSERLGKAYLATIVEHELPRLKKELATLKGREYIGALIQLMKFVYPQMQAVQYSEHLDVKASLETRILKLSGLQPTPYNTPVQMVSIIPNETQPTLPPTYTQEQELPQEPPQEQEP